MNGRFIRDFLEVLAAVPDFAADLFTRESLQSKMLRMGGNDPQKIFKGLSNLRHRGIVRKRGERYSLTKRGYHWIGLARTKYLKFKTGTWDGKWRLVMFDIPQEFHAKRIHFGRRLKSLGFYPLQKSVFVFPYPCEEDLGYIASELGISDYVDIVVAESTGSREREIKKWFGL